MEQEQQLVLDIERLALRIDLSQVAALQLQVKQLLLLI
jgi:hypothetical protein